MKIMFLNNEGAGFADYIDIPHGTTVQELFALKMGHLKPDQFLIRVNRQPVPRDQVLCEADRVSITPTKIEGAQR
jgi:sulfur carrier protein ThiS